MITFKPIVISNNRRKDGTYPVKIRVYFNGSTRRLPTTLVCTEKDLTKSLRIKNGVVIDKANEIISQMRNVTKDISPFDLESKDVDWLVAHIKSRLSGDNFHLDFFAFGEEYVLCKREKTRSPYYAAMNTLKRYLNRETLDINEITKTMLMDFVIFVDNEPRMHYNYRSGEYVPCKREKKTGLSGIHLMKLQHIYNAAKDRYNDEDIGKIVIPKSPFDKVRKVFPVSEGQKNLGQELMQKIISANVSDHLTRIALDAFILSFGLMGANLADMYYAKSFDDDVWEYNRLKTMTRRQDKAKHRVVIPEEMHPYIKRLYEHRSCWWLGELHKLASDNDLCTARVNRLLKRWCKQNDIAPFTFYAARHTWASLARQCGVEKATIDECLCHKGDFIMADIYAERNWDLLQEANRKVLDLFQW